MDNKVLFLAVVGLILVGLLRGWIFRATPETLSLPAESLQVSLMDARHVLLASRGVLLDDPIPELAARNMPLPTQVNLWTRRGASHISIDDQGRYGSCTACAMRYAWRLWKNRLDSSRTPLAPSRMFWYAQSRLRIGEKLHLDRGSTNAATVWALREKGLVPEETWPYTRENLSRRPLPLVEHAALSQRSSQPVAFRFFRTPQHTIEALRTALAQGKSIIIAVLVFSSFMSATTLRSGKIPLPNTRRERRLGGHAITLTGYDFSRAVFTFRNSWGPGVGMNGLFEIPFAYIANPNLAGDAWIL